MKVILMLMMALMMLLGSIRAEDVQVDDEKV